MLEFCNDPYQSESLLNFCQRIDLFYIFAFCLGFIVVTHHTETDFKFKFSLYSLHPEPFPRRVDYILGIIAMPFLGKYLIK